MRWVQWFLDPIRIQARTATGVALEEERKDKKKVPLKIEQTAAAEWVKSVQERPDLARQLATWRANL